MPRRELIKAPGPGPGIVCACCGLEDDDPLAQAARARLLELGWNAEEVAGIVHGQQETIWVYRNAPSRPTGRPLLPGGVKDQEEARAKTNRDRQARLRERRKAAEEGRAVPKWAEKKPNPGESRE